MRHYKTAEYMNSPIDGQGVRLLYKCTHCEKFDRFFFLRIGGNKSGRWLMKRGHFSAWEITGETNVERLVGAHAGYYKKGLICEDQG